MVKHRRFARSPQANNGQQLVSKMYSWPEPDLRANNESARWAPEPALPLGTLGGAATRFRIGRPSDDSHNCFDHAAFCCRVSDGLVRTGSPFAGAQPEACRKHPGLYLFHVLRIPGSRN